MSDKNDTLEELSKRVRQLEDESAIIQLKRDYFNASDRQDYSAFVDCFTEDAVVDFPAFDYKGNREGISEVFQAFAKQNPAVNSHQGFNPSINILDENNAEGTWNLFFFCFYKEQNTIFHGSGLYFDRYKKTSQGWKISECRTTMHFSMSIPVDPEKCPVML